MPNGWKFTRADGTDHRTGTINYRDNIGREMVHPCPTRSRNVCGEGYHLGKTLKGAGKYGAPGAVFRCSYSRKDVLGEDDVKVRVSRLTVIEELPAWKGYGPRGKQVQASRLAFRNPWFENVGQPYKQPIWSENMIQVDSWDAALLPPRLSRSGPSRMLSGLPPLLPLGLPPLLPPRLSRGLPPRLPPLGMSLGLPPRTPPRLSPKLWAA